MKKYLCLLLIPLLLLMGSCSLEEKKEEGRLFVDSAGRSLHLNDVQSIAPTGALAQMVLLPLASDLFCGLASDWSSNAQLYLPQELLTLPVYGQILGSEGDMNLEEVLRLQPDLLIDIGETSPATADDLDALQEQMGIPLVHIAASLENMGQAYRLLGELLNRQDQGNLLADYCEGELQLAKDLRAAAAEEQVPTVVYCLGDDGLNVLAKGSYHAQLLDLLCQNVAVLDKPSPGGFGNAVDMEQLLLWDPQVLLFAPGSIYDSVAEDPVWNRLQAISSGRYYQVPQGPYNWMGMPPSINRYLGMMWLTHLFYDRGDRETFYEEVAHYYQLFYACQLTEEMFDDLLAGSAR